MPLRSLRWLTVAVTLVFPAPAMISGVGLLGLLGSGDRCNHLAACRVGHGGARLDDEWCAFFKAHDFVLCTVHAANGDRPLEIYRFFRDELEAEFLQFIPVVERATAKALPLANVGWSEPTGRGRPLYTQAGWLVPSTS